jgi:predicted unusual protein kinase regulating ubiquinone biosynthesis (AarF/ABC1/UbiB family)
VQYPGVARSIDSDVDNVGALIRLSGLLPPGFDLAPLLAEAKSQLRDETDYLREADQIRTFRALLGTDTFDLPDPQDDLTGQGVLAMTYLEGGPIEAIEDRPQAVRDAVMRDLLDLMFREMFDFGLMQSDPNFANYRVNGDTGRVALLDFGATRPVPRDVAEAYRRLFVAAMGGDRDGLREAALTLGFFAPDTAPRHRKMVLDMLVLVFAPLAEGRVFDFGDPALGRAIHEAGLEMAAERDFVHVPPIETLYMQRKFGGLFLLGSRLRARVDLAGLLRSRADPAGAQKNAPLVRGV